MAEKRKTEVETKSNAEAAQATASRAKIDGRYLRLFFRADPPYLDRIEFRFNSSPSWKEHWLQRGDREHPLNLREVEVAISRCFLGYVVWVMENKSGQFLFGSRPTDAGLAMQLSSAIFQSKHRIHELFFGENPAGKDLEPDVTHLVFPAIPGISKSGKGEKPVRIAIDSEFLPPDCIRVFWDRHSAGDPVLLETLNKVRDLMKRIRKPREAPAEGDQALSGQGQLTVIPTREEWWNKDLIEVIRTCDELTLLTSYEGPKEGLWKTLEERILGSTSFSLKLAFLRPNDPFMRMCLAHVGYGRGVLAFDPESCRGLLACIEKSANPSNKKVSCVYWKGVSPGPILKWKAQGITKFALGLWEQNRGSTDLSPVLIVCGGPLHISLGKHCVIALKDAPSMFSESKTGGTGNRKL